MGLEERRMREKENRKNAILKAARKLSFEKGFKSITVASIARKAELSKGAVYLYFNSKEEIYLQILLREIEKFQSSLSDICERGGNAADMLKHLTDIYIDSFIKDKELFRIFMSVMLHTDETEFSEELNRQLVQATNTSVDIIEKVLQYGVEQGDFPENLNIRQHKNAIWGLLNGIISLHLFTGKEMTKEQRIRTTVRTSLEAYIRGLSTQGLKDRLDIKPPEANQGTPS